MDRGITALMVWLAIASVGLIASVTVLTVLLTDEDTEANGGWLGVAWMSLLRTLDAGTMGGDTGGPVFLLLMLMVTIGGIFIVSAFIGVLTTGLNARIQWLRKGRSRIIERDHTIVLGWSEHVFTVVAELVEANQSERRSCVVILADRDKVDMEDEIRFQVPDTGRTRVICRSGNPLNRADLELVSPDTAKAIMVLPQPGDESDTSVVKVLLLLNNRTWQEPRPAVVAAVQDSDNLVVARLAAGKTGLVVDADDFAVRLVVQSHRQAGLSAVWDELLSFVGNEFYVRAEPELEGSTYGDALLRYELGAPVGMRRADGRILVNPPMNTLIEVGDSMVVIAEDDLLIRLCEEPPHVCERAMVTVPGRAATPDRTMVIGWNSRATKIIDLLDQLVRPGSVIDIAAPHRPTAELQKERQNLTVGYQRCDPTIRRSLDQLNLGDYQHIVVLSDESVDPGDADDRTLVTLLHLRDIEVRLGDPYSIVTEMNDDRNREVAQVTKADDFIVSTKLVCLLLTQLAESRDVHAVLEDLLDPAGSEIYLKPAPHYLRAGAGANFATVVEVARSRGETAIGYRLGGESHLPPSYGVRLNPLKDAPLALGERDQVIVVAES
ncbi:CASTOR/POLLUX-related putative ion channel [Streptomyces sp. NBC_01435]|uniref:CASTOR/POLLUX-related putative ion channel n=1 Tax=Streptomyces sp. NBC_01435 TaxID=2903865 RepID=UPI002E2FC950|nr:potassium transporter TrkA [Streptomyces sp. NBC_01435]